MDSVYDDRETKGPFKLGDILKKDEPKEPKEPKEEKKNAKEK